MGYWSTGTTYLLFVLVVVSIFQQSLQVTSFTLKLPSTKGHDFDSYHSAQVEAFEIMSEAVKDKILSQILEVAIDASKKAGDIIVGNAGPTEITQRKANSRDLLTLIDPLCEKVRFVSDQLCPPFPCVAPQVSRFCVSLCFAGYQRDSFGFIPRSRLSWGRRCSAREGG
jgi:hypothetical protein